MEEGVFQTQPITSSQHAFRAGFSTQTALSTLLNKIERSLEKGGIVFAAFLDIIGAFDNISHEAVERNLQERNIPSSIQAWYLNYLKGRTMLSDLNGESVRRHIRKGVPQGGCLSPIAYNLATEDMLKKFTNRIVEAIGFADDTCLAVSGQKPEWLVKVLQKAVKDLETWGNAAGLEFSAEKSEIMVFSRRTKHPVDLNALPRIILQGQPIEYVQEATYLGMKLDPKLNWRPHLTAKLRSCKQKLMTFRRKIGSFWGPNPLLTRWIYTSTIRPALQYGSICWAKKSHLQWFQRRTNSLQRLAMLMLAPVRRGTPTLGMQVLYHLVPVHLDTLELASKTFLRLKNTPEMQSVVSNMSKAGHLAHIKKHLTSKGIPHDKVDFRSGVILPPSTFHSDIIRLDTPLEDGPNYVHSFVKGRGTKTSFGGSFVSYLNRAPLAEGQQPLGKWSSSFQAEFRALEELCRDLIAKIINGQIHPSKILIYVTTKAVVQRLRHRRQTTPSVIIVRRLLEVLQNHAPTSLLWSKSSVLSAGRRRAEFLAKQSAQAIIRTPDIPTQDIPLDMFHNLCRDASLVEWEQKWQALPPDYCRQSRIFMKKPDWQATKEILKLDRPNLGQLARFLTGHNRTRRHQAVVDKNTDPLASLCRFCPQPSTAVEDPDHIIRSCPHWEERRIEFLQTDDGSDPSWYDISLFLDCDEIRNMEAQELETND